MDTTVNQISPVEYELEITSSADELKPELDRALRSQRARTQAKGFRPGKVPLPMVKKLYGPALAYGVAEQKVQEVVNEQILRNDDYDLAGQPVLTELDYEIDQDLRAVVRFGVRPEVALKDVSGIELPRLKVDVTDELVEEQVEEFRRANADLVPTEEPAGEHDQVVFDVQEVDVETGSPIVGRKDENREFFLDDPNVSPQWKEPFQGKKAGDTFSIDIAHGDHDHGHAHRYDVSLKEVKHRELPELTDETVSALTEERFSTVEELRSAIRGELESRTQEQSRELIESQIMRKMIELHPIPVPRSAVELYLDSFIEDVKQRNRGNLPEDFDEARFREGSRDEAERQAQWMFVRDAVIASEGLEVTDEDLNDYFANMSKNEQFSPEMLRDYYERIGALENVKQNVLSRKVFSTLTAKFDLQDLTMEEYTERMRREAEAETSDDAETSD
ncbi:MAG: trigger factor [Bacteroidota bacterium]